MNVSLWIVAGVLAALYLLAGVTKATRPKDKLRESMPWVEDLSPGLVKFIGTAEILGALGLILPKLTDIGGNPLTALAATGLVIIQAGAIPVHLRRGEQKVLPVNVVLLLGAAFVAAGRFGWLS